MEEEDSTGTNKTKAALQAKTMRQRKTLKRKPVRAKQTKEKATVSIVEKPDTKEYEVASIEEHQNVLFKPNAGPQTEFLAASEREVLYGGSAGGMLKSDTLPPFAVMRQNKLGELLETR